MSLAFLFHYLMLNMFQMLIQPSSGACDLFVELFHGLYCSVRIEVFALSHLFSGECLVVTCVVVLEVMFLQILAAAVSYGYSVFFVCSVFFRWFFLNIFWYRVYELTHTWYVACWCCVRCGLAGVVWYPDASWSTTGLFMWNVGVNDRLE